MTLICHCYCTLLILLVSVIEISFFFFVFADHDGFWFLSYLVSLPSSQLWCFNGMLLLFNYLLSALETLKFSLCDWS